MVHTILAASAAVGLASGSDLEDQTAVRRG